MSRPPLVLLHGVTMSSAAWAQVVPLIADDVELHLPTLPGHRGGPAPLRRPVSIDDLVDVVERDLDERGLERAHLAGNSLGGWIAVELARRGRALSVTALCPGGFPRGPRPDGAGSGPGSRRGGGVAGLRDAQRTARRTRLVAPLALQVPAVRRRAFGGVARHADRLPPALAVRFASDLAACTVLDDVLAARSGVEAFAPEAAAQVPMQVLWAEHDRLFAPQRYADAARALLPGAEHAVLPAVGHVPMIDDPALVARWLLRGVSRGRRPRSDGGAPGR